VGRHAGHRFLFRFGIFFLIAQIPIKDWVLKLLDLLDTLYICVADSFFVAESTLLLLSLVMHARALPKTEHDRELRRDILSNDGLCCHGDHEETKSDHCGE
jgi:hypothetical protein